MLNSILLILSLVLFVVIPLIFCAQPAMLSHLRLHRRAPSNPTSPVPEQPSPIPSPMEYDGASPLGTNPRPSSSSAAPSQPPILPPITRVTTELDIPLGPQDVALRLQSTSQPDSRRSSHNEHLSFIGGLALQKYRRDRQADGQVGSISLSASTPSAPPDRDPRSPAPFVASSSHGNPQSKDILQKQGKSPSSFIAPTDFQNSISFVASSGAKHLGLRPSGTRLASEPSTSCAPASEPPKSKKSLPFLKNPMSTLLMRRKSNQPIPDLLPLPLGNRKNDVRHADPSIRGTRVHDFTTPRDKRNTAASPYGPPSSSTGTTPHQFPASHSQSTLVQEELVSDISSSDHGRSTSNVSNASHRSFESTHPTVLADNGIPKPPSLERKPVPSNTLLPVPPKNGLVGPSSLVPAASQPSSIAAISTRTKCTISKRSLGSRKTSLLSQKSTRNFVDSTVPKHMKSTSSRFSFDMLGPAKQEKLLEERHRQKQQEKQISEVSERDSRFDDMEDFDYDAMDFDGDFEERIPGVNADYDDDGFYEEEISGINAETVEEQKVDDYDEVNDPDNDQENFAGFVFQRSNPVSNLTSPVVQEVAITPRDADGRVIGFAMTKDSPVSNLVSPPEQSVSPNSSLEISPVEPRLQNSALGSENEEQERGTITAQKTINTPPPAVTNALSQDDELYFDGGLDEFDGENIGNGNDEPFDENLFDLDDTDEYGRPLPGVFAKVQSLHHSRKKKQRESSDGTSHISGLSGISESSTHTSVSGAISAPQFPVKVSTEKTLGDEVEKSMEAHAMDKSNVSSTQKQQIAAYQAALAAAAYQAAASGKFRREPSPPSAEVTITSPINTRSSQIDMENINNFDEGSFGNNLDGYELDYELDDDAMVAEANASLLANDADGFYGQEFGFYSAPIPQHHGVQTSLNTENSFHYFNGGYFGPSGVNRSTSGRIVSREPNLTPITERSEYSNRNSVMSGMGITPMGGTNAVASPGIAQLAALVSDDDEETMSLSALLKLRSRAWGGSQASLISSRDGSPRPEAGREGAASPWGAGSGVGGNCNCPYPGISSHARKGSSFSVLSRDSEPGSGTASPTLTMPMNLHQVIGTNSPAPRSLNSPPHPVCSSIPQHATSSPFPPVSEEEDEQIQANSQDDICKNSQSPLSVTYLLSGPRPGSPDPPQAIQETAICPVGGYFGGTSISSSSPPSIFVKRGSQKSHRTHYHRKKGSADSISYVKEKETESGETRWVMERRRTADSGEVEILDREILENGRI